MCTIKINTYIYILLLKYNNKKKSKNNKKYKIIKKYKNKCKNN